MRRVKTDGKSTAEKLKDAAALLFGKYGFDGTSVRMIAAEAGFTAGQITKCFGSKEQLFDEIITDIYRSACFDYDPLIEEFEQAEAHGGCSEEKAWELIERVVDLQIDFAFSEDSRMRVKIIGVHTAGTDNPHTTELIRYTKEKIETYTAGLFRIVFHQKRRLHLITVSRAVNGCIISFAQNPELLLDEVMGSHYMPSSAEWVKNYLKNYIMDSIRLEAKREEHR